MVFFFSVFLFASAAYVDSVLTNFMVVATFLTWHNLFEFISILSAMSIFIVTYYTYEESRNVRMIVLGCAFFFMGLLDIFHSLSYKGMADFFIPNISANRATTFWVLSRFIGSAGILTAFFIPLKWTSKIKKCIFLIPTFSLGIILLLSVTYLPEFFPKMFVDGEGMTGTKILMEYIIITFMIITFYKITSEYRKTLFRQDYLLMIGILLCIFSEIAFVHYAKVYDAYNYLGHVYKFIAYLVMFKAMYAENVKIPYREMKKAQKELKDYSDNLNVLVKQRTKKLEDLTESLLMDLEYAKEMQRSLLPAKMPNDRSVSFYAGYLPAKRLSGDFYNVIKLDQNNIAVYIGDVAGHGVSAAMLTVFANQNIEPLKETDEAIDIVSPQHVLENIYKSFNDTNFNDETYLVMLYGIYNTKDRTFTYASGGINVPPLVIKNNGSISEIDVTGFAICKLSKYLNPSFEDRSIQLENGDKILFSTDGLIEAQNAIGKRYSQERLIDFVKLNHPMNGVELSDAIQKNLFQYIGLKSNLQDDVTFLVLEVH